MRLKSYDYTEAGYYFLTDVTANRIPYFGTIESGRINMSEAGILASEEMIRTGELRDNVIIDEFIVMPDHVHAIVVITSRGYSLCSLVARYEATEGIARYEATGGTGKMDPQYFSSISPKPESVSAIVRAYKSAVSKRCHESGIHDFSWQRGFHDRIIRNQQELDAIRRYIRRNPERWWQKEMMNKE